jgi:hypothetical protein
MIMVATTAKLSAGRARLTAVALLLALAGCTPLTQPASRPPGPVAKSAPGAPAPSSPAPGDEYRGPAPPLGGPQRPTPLPQPPPPRSDTSAPSAALLAQSRAARAAGRYSQATSATERALQIDPNNAALWVELGEIQLATGNLTQAATMARKALTLARGDRAVAADADRLLRAAER